MYFIVYIISKKVIDLFNLFCNILVKNQVKGYFDIAYRLHINNILNYMEANVSYIFITSSI